MLPNDDLRILEIKELLPPIAILEKFPTTDQAAKTVSDARNAIHEILNDRDDRLLVITGPCSLHDPKAALEYGHRLAGGHGQVDLWLRLHLHNRR